MSLKEIYSPYTDTGVELPHCTICLERMDESVSTVLTILCNHKVAIQLDSLVYFLLDFFSFIH